MPHSNIKYDPVQIIMEIIIHSNHILKLTLFYRSTSYRRANYTLAQHKYFKLNKYEYFDSILYSSFSKS